MKIKEFEIDSYEEIIPPLPEEKKSQYLELLNEIDFKLAEMNEEKERILKLLNE